MVGRGRGISGLLGVGRCRVVGVGNRGSGLSLETETHTHTARARRGTHHVGVGLVAGHEVLEDREARHALGLGDGGAHVGDAAGGVPVVRCVGGWVGVDGWGGERLGGAERAGCPTHSSQKL